MTHPESPAAMLADGRVADALDRQRGLVTSHPTPVGRLLLAELLGVAGEYAAARAELRQVDGGPGWAASRERFDRVLRAAGRRAGLRRVRLADPEAAHVRHRWAAARLGADGDRALRHVDRADAVAPHLLGHVDGREFEGLRDADDVFGSVLELFVAGRYAWLAWGDVRRVRLAPAAGVLDGAFRPAEVTLATGEVLAVVLPLIYPAVPGTDGAFLAGLDTDFTADAGPVRGLGARVVLFGDDEVELKDVRQVDVRPAG